MKNKYEFHYVANIFPMMIESEFNSLKNDISSNGLREPIWLFNNQIIDGRNRYLACLETKTEPIFRNFEGEESGLIDFVISLNIHRRHLNTSQKACLAIEILPKLEENAKSILSQKMSAIRKNDTEVLSILTKPANSREAASKLFGVSGGYISLAKKIKESSNELFDKVKKGELTLQKAQIELNKSLEVLSILTKPNTDIESKSESQSEVLSILTKPDETTNIILTKSDLQKINSYIAAFKSVSKEEATQFVISQKKKRTPKVIQIKEKNMDEVKTRLGKKEKDKLKKFAKMNHKSMSEVIRELIEKIEINE